MKKITLSLITILMLSILFLINGMNFNYVYGAESDFTNVADFSQAKYNLKWTVVSVYLNITDVSIIDDSNNFDYYYKITNSATEVKSEYKTREEMETDGWKGLKSIEGGKSENNDITDAIELNQDLHLWIMAYDNVNVSQDVVRTKLLVKDNQLEKIELPKYQKIFKSTFLTSNETQIVFNLPWSDGVNGNSYKIKTFNIKIGKITDNNILKSMKNNESDGFEKLLTYAKNEKSPLYNKNLTSKGTSFGFHSQTGDELIKLPNVENKAFYYLYAKLDDENGKYYPIEGVTLAMAKTENIGDDLSWVMFFYGDENIEWGDFDVPNGGGQTNNQPQESDGTTATRSLPYTGSGLIVAFLIGILSIIAVVFYKKNEEFRGIK